MCCCKKKKHKRSRPRPCPLTINRRNLKTAIASQGESSSSKDVAEETTCISNTEVRKHRKKVTDSEDTTASKSCKSSKKVERKVNEKTAEGTVDSDTPIANNKDSDEEGEEVTEKNYMYNEKEILYVNREMLSEGPLDCILDGFDDDERARSIEMLPKIPHIVWDPFQPLEKLEDDVREFLFSCQYLRRSSLLSHTSTMPKAPKPPRAKPHARIVTLNKKILSLDAFKRPKVEITEEEIEPSTCTGNCSQKTTSDKRSNKGSLGRTRTSTKTSRDESCDSA
ncbi:unnamed protein product [Bursaphelenchus okinawaensis]|uniref:Uncharacterized protein n=1 Tax=Bursaphelenchus okinawaensis TaxID=465554 RepID=A0A811LJX2_9BILA|nr:unnamed protein product [Bursaphelenchus okinawaensis]CAG9124609.1 unnamed protein product [Bursaphelenchus okinawaensis]